MVEKYTLGIDIGTTGVKASVLDVDKGMIVAHSLKEHPLFHPKPGYAEQEGDNYWKAVVQAVKDCFKQGSYGDKIAGVSLSGLVGVMLPIDKEGKPVRPGMIWMDSGTSQSLYETSCFIKEMEKKDGKKVGCIEETAWINNLINTNELINLTKLMPDCEYKVYLENLVLKSH